MKTAAILYHSKTGTTWKYAEEIKNYLESKGISARISPIQAYREDLMNEVDYVFLGCWTSGLMVILQHPEKEWVDFAVKLPATPSAKLVLFTTYKILTGSMFRKMYQQVQDRFSKPSLELKARNSVLSAADKEKLDSILA